MDIAFSTGCLYRYPLEEIFQIAGEAGFDGIELLIGSNSYNVEISNIRELSDKYALPVLSLHSPFISYDGWVGFWERIWKSLSLAIELSIPVVNFHPPTGIFPRYRLTDELSEHVKAYKEALDGSGITLTIENLPAIVAFRVSFVSRYLPRSVKNIHQLVEFARENDIHLTFDTTHIGTTGINLLGAYEVFKDRIANIHLSDYDGRWQHLLPGTGHLPLGKLLAQVRDDGYEGAITLETSPFAMEHEDRAKVLQNARASLQYIKDGLQD